MADSETWRPPIGGGRRHSVGGGSLPPAGEATPDSGPRVSPVAHRYPDGKDYLERMEKEFITLEGENIQIDVDRHGGVFLDHGELGKLLGAKNLEVVKGLVEGQILSAKAKYDVAGADHRLK